MNHAVVLSVLVLCFRGPPEQVAGNGLLDEDEMGQICVFLNRQDTRTMFENAGMLRQVYTGLLVDQKMRHRNRHGLSESCIAVS